jgi:hypothetical protein
VVSAVDPASARATHGQPSRKENPMHYLLLIYENEKIWTEMPEADRMRIYGEYRTYTDEIKQSGHWLGGNPLQPTHTATTVRVRDGKTAITDGPFAETREQLGGYYLVEARDLDEATRLAAGIPGAKLGSIEVRPVMPIG